MKAYQIPSLFDVLNRATALCGCHVAPTEPLDQRWQTLCDPLSIRSRKAFCDDMRQWIDWWVRTQQVDPLGNASTIRSYIVYLETAGRKLRTTARLFCSIRKFLRAIGWPDPDAEDVIARYSRSRQAPPLATVPVGRWFGWKDVEACIATADDQCPMDVRNIALLLVLYETMALPDQVLGCRMYGSWHHQPITCQAIRSRRDGTAVLRLGATATTSSREAFLSPSASTWVSRWLSMRPPHGTAMFISRRGTPLAPKSWEQAMRSLALRAGIHPDRFSLRALRNGTARDLLRAGTHIEDVRRAGGWNQLGSVVRLLEAPAREQPLRHLAQLHGHLSPTTPEQLFKGRGPRTLRQSLLRKIIPTTGDLFEPLRRKS